jgi:hydrogenase small subunit
MEQDPVPYGRKTQHDLVIPELDILWLSAALGCDGDTISITAATRPSLEDLVLGAIPGLPKVNFYNPVLEYLLDEPILKVFHRAATGELGRPFILVVEGSIPNERSKNKREGYWAAFGTDSKGQPKPTCDWIKQLAPHAWAVVAAGTCAAYGGIHAMEGNPTECTGLPDFLSRECPLKTGIPLVCVPGCPVQPDNFMEVLLYLLNQAARGTRPPDSPQGVPQIPLDEQLRPKWLFQHTTHEGCGRGGYYEQAEFAREYGEPTCIVKLGCWGPVVQCNVGKRGWINGVGGCPSVGGICIGCTMPGFPDKFMQPSFLSEPAGAMLSTAAVTMYGLAVRYLRSITRRTMNQEPNWRCPRPHSETGDVSGT